ncbi:outer membrane protein assembly factor BamB family protein [Kitasatospora sp. McL0602]|uniref:outer membrane protein assembly factor BamB family protein n=1 Tax=Kitasatospora sp. McL0602 TaxID=3439530 RepID=UPI003F8A7D43
MAQEHSGTAGQEPVGYDYQQPWYPQQQGQGADPWADGQQQPYPGPDQQQWGTPDQGQGQWQSAQPVQPGFPEQREPDAYQGYAPEGYYPAYPETEQQHQLYAPPGADGYYTPPGADGYYAPYGSGEPAVDPFGQTPPAADPFASAPVAPAPFAAATDPVPKAAVAPEADPEADGEPAARPGLVERAKAAADAVISADHAPSRRALAIRAGAGAAALAVLVTAGVLVTSDDGSSPAPGDSTAAAPGFAVAHAKAWTAQPAAAAPAGADDSLVGSWLLAEAVVRADTTGVHAYALADGKPTWTVAPPAPGAVACGLSPTVSSAGLGAALFRPQADPKSPCNLLAAVDTKTGKTSWTKTLSDAKENYAAHVSVTDTSVIAVGDDKVSAWAAADGKDSWQYAGQGKYCTLSGSASGATVLLHSSCADSAPVDQAVALNAGDGKVKWWRGLNNQPKTVTVLSAEPAAVLTTGDKPTDDKVFAWGAAGDPAAEIPLSTPAGRLDVSRGSFDAVPNAYFQGQSMVTTLTPTDGSATSVTAYDLATGKPLWKTQPTEKGKARAVGFDNGALLLAVDERLDQPAHLSRFPLTGGQETAGGAYPQGTGSLLTSGRVLAGGGKFVVVPDHSANFGIATAFQSKS